LVWSITFWNISYNLISNDAFLWRVNHHIAFSTLVIQHKHCEHVGCGMYFGFVLLNTIVLCKVSDLVGINDIHL
jgi:hypothetical protein